MYNKKPPFEITNEILDLIAEISELVGQVSATKRLSANPTLRRSNRIRTIYSSLAIEQNNLSLEQVTAVLNGKRVLAPPKDIAEVKNVYEFITNSDVREMLQGTSATVNRILATDYGINYEKTHLIKFFLYNYNIFHYNKNVICGKG